PEGPTPPPGRRRPPPPVTPGNPCRPVASGEPLRGCARRPLDVERAELGSAPLLVLFNLHNLLNLPILPNLPRAQAHAVERHLRPPPTAERQPTPRRAAREVDQPP